MTNISSEISLYFSIVSTLIQGQLILVHLMNSSDSEVIIKFLFVKYARIISHIIIIIKRFFFIRLVRVRWDKEVRQPVTESLYNYDAFIVGPC